MLRKSDHIGCSGQAWILTVPNLNGIVAAWLLLLPRPANRSAETRRLWQYGVLVLTKQAGDISDKDFAGPHHELTLTGVHPDHEPSLDVTDLHRQCLPGPVMRMKISVSDDGVSRAAARRVMLSFLEGKLLPEDVLTNAWDAYLKEVVAEILRAL
jgi:hypothetical protein